ncbi:MAG TPA: DUF2207 domain-containing protein [Alphaproteobacteria bacterium]|nr:DUF2207 domain-containing protein [Alphaproteobacteria bacterium]
MTVFVVIFVALASLVAQQARANERITLFHSAIEVHQDGSMRVVETIAVEAEGGAIKHGIYRDFPTLYRSPEGVNYRVGFSVASVKRDGADEPYVIQGLPNGKRIRIGRADTFVSEGPHTYEITYDVTGELGFYKTYDELYWNVNGTGWGFDSDRVEAEVDLPAGARILDYTGYTGYEGSTAKDFTAHKTSDSHIEFATTRPFEPRENLTIVVTWPKGIVAEPTKAQRAEQFLAQNTPIFISGLGFIGVLAYYMAAWLRVGRDPPQGTIIPLYHPPEDLSPAAVRFIRRMGYDRKAFTAALVDMAVKGYLKIVDDGHKFTLEKTGRGSGWSPEEARVSAALFTSADTIEMEQKNYAKFGAAVNRVRETLENEDRKQFFARNQGYFWLGILITLGVGGLTALTSASPKDAFGAAMVLSIWVGLTAIFLVRAIQRMQSGANSFGARVAGMFQAVFMMLFFIPFGFAAVLLGRELAQNFGLWAALLVGCTAALNAIFFELMKAPTIAGRKIMDEIEGLRMYLGTAEQERLDALTPPKETPELFEAYLPYAMALDVENQWNKRFERVFAAADQAPGTVGTGGYSPAWYSGPRLSHITTGGFAAALGGALSSAAASAATAPGSSSGMSGGSSGGGGGGGGGGGW